MTAQSGAVFTFAGSGLNAISTRSAKMRACFEIRLSGLVGVSDDFISGDLSRPLAAFLNLAAARMHDFTGA